jgi:FkbM family methyltransferase
MFLKGRILLIVSIVLFALLVTSVVLWGPFFREDNETRYNSYGLAQGKWLRDLNDWYYPKSNTQGFEELFIRDYFQDKRGGIFVDIGANHYRERNVTYYLERHLDWSGIAVDALSEFGEEYRKYRHNTKFFSFFIGDKSDQNIDFYIIASNKRVSSYSEEVRKEHSSEASRISVKTITLDDLLAKSNASRIDLLNIDIELAEPMALKGFSIDKYKPELVIIENHEEVAVPIRQYFLKHDYVAIEPYSQLDELNDYYIPAARLEQYRTRKGIVPNFKSFQ